MLVNHFPLDGVQKAQEDIELKKKMERESAEEKQSPAPSKSGSQKVRLGLAVIQCLHNLLLKFNQVKL